MGKHGKRIKQGLIIFNIVAFIALLVLAYFQYQSYQDNLKKKDEIVKKYQEITNNKELDDKKIDEINAKIDELNNIDEKIKSIRNEVYKLSGDLEKKIKNKETNEKIPIIYKKKKQTKVVFNDK